jgi:ankyrin repeat protein
MNNTPLHYAAASGSEAILTYLLDKNARIIISTVGNTPLHVVRRFKKRNDFLGKIEYI